MLRDFLYQVLKIPLEVIFKLQIVSIQLIVALQLIQEIVNISLPVLRGAGGLRLLEHGLVQESEREGLHYSGQQVAVEHLHKLGEYLREGAYLEGLLLGLGEDVHIPQKVSQQLCW